MPPKETPAHDLRRIKELAKRGGLSVELWPQVQSTAWDDFGWKVADIRDAITRLKKNHYYKTAPQKNNPSILLDYYKARNLKDGEDVFFHLHINDRDQLVISSCHELD